MASKLPKLMTIEEVAEYLRVSVRTVQRMIKDGRLGAISLGRTWRISTDVLAEFVAQNGDVPKDEDDDMHPFVFEDDKDDQLKILCDDDLDG